MRGVIALGGRDLESLIVERPWEAIGSDESRWVVDFDKGIALDSECSDPYAFLDASPSSRCDAAQLSNSLVVLPNGDVRLRRGAPAAAGLFFRLGAGFVEFDSQLERIAHSGQGHVAYDRSSLLHFLWRGRAAPGSSLYAELNSLLVGEELVCNRGKAPVRRRYWWPLHGDLHSSDEEVLRSSAVRRIGSAVERCTSSARACGVLLSGGVDSSLLAALAVDRGVDMTAFTVEFDERFGINETAYATHVVRALDLRHRVVRVGLADAEGIMRRLFNAPHPRAAPAAIASEALREAAEDDGLGTVVSALGADECFGGYHKMLAHLAAQLHEIEAVGGSVGAFFEQPPEQFMGEPGRLFLGIAEFVILPDLLELSPASGDLQKVLAQDVQFYRSCMAHKPDAHPLELMASHEYVFRAAELLVPALHPRQCGAASNVVFPFLEHEVYSWASALDPKHCFWHEQDAWWAKRLLRSVALDYLDESIVMREREVFRAPIEHWLTSNSIRAMFAEEIGDSPLWQMDLVSSKLRDDAIAALGDYAGVNGDVVWQQRLWGLVVLCAWLNRCPTSRGRKR